MDEKGTSLTSTEAYIAAFPPEIQRLLQDVRETIRSAAPEAKEKISYQMPTFDLHGNLVHFAAFKNHIGFYPGADGIAAFKEELSAYKGAKGSVQFPLDKPLPHELISRITAYRVSQNKARAEAKRGKKV
ncbi:iron chaperone [Cohnella sp. GCM10020058]|uniref:iron chaperone n=1 Tax=Cohnella sp. GCM10020058 TaxID=3317330 RepID=UPI003631FCE2